MTTLKISAQNQNNDDLIPHTLEEIKYAFSKGVMHTLNCANIEDTLLRNLTHQYLEIGHRIEKQLSKLWNKTHA